MDGLVVHPAYWRRGHGEALVRWSLALADADGIKQGVSATPMGVKLYERLGYKPVDECVVPGDEDDAEGCKTVMCRYTPAEKQ